MDPKKFPVGNIHKTDEKIKDTQNLNDLFLAKILKIMDKNELIKQLSFEVVKFEQKLKIETQRIEINYRKNLEQIETEFQSNLENDRQLKHAFEKKSNDDISSLQNLEEKEKLDFESQIEVLKVDHAAKVEYEKQRNKDLELMIDELKQGQQEELVSMLDQHKQDLIKLRVRIKLIEFISSFINLLIITLIINNMIKYYYLNRIVFSIHPLKNIYFIRVFTKKNARKYR